MPNLPTDPKQRQEAILAAVVDRWEGVPDSGRVMDRKHYVDSREQRDDLAAVPEDSGEKRLHYVLVSLADLYSTKDAPGRARRTHYVYSIEIVYQFEESRPEAGFGENSSVGFNALLARGEAAFGNDTTLGFNEADNSGIDSLGLNTFERASVEFVDEVLCHTKSYNLEVTVLGC